MIDNELQMKLKGEQKVYKDIVTKAGNSKQVSSTQIGQQLILDEALRILPDVWDWINNGSAKVYRGELTEYFVDEQFTLQKITETLLLLSGTIYYGEGYTKIGVSKNRHKKITTIQNIVMPELDWNQVWRFLEVVIELSEYFETQRVNDFSDSSYKIKLTYACNISDTIVEKLAQKANSSFYPMPITTPPIPWSVDDSGEIVGGYSGVQYQLVRANQKHINYNKFSPAIFDSINYIQSTPWIVNKTLLETLKIDLKKPNREDYIKMEYPDSSECRWELGTKLEEIDLPQEELEELRIIRNQHRDQKELYKAEQSDYESELGKYRAVRLALTIAERYKDEEVIYFPHSYDFRGRVYPLSIGLTPQGSDAVKSLLLYKNVTKLDEEGVEWIWAYLASLYGEDKLEFKQRIQRGKELLNADYKDADEPYQFLSHQLEIQKWILDDSYIPNVRIHLDACNSGSQFTSGITRDLAGCIATNVIPSYNEDGTPDRQDAYLLVSEKALELTTIKVNNAKDPKTKQMFEFFRDLLLDNGRKICKVPVMVSNYGGTTGGRTDILWNMFRELKVDRKWITRKVASEFSKIIGESITGTLSGGKEFEKYIHNMNNIIAKSNKPICWTTSDGFQVVHVKNKELKPKQVTCMLPGARRSTTITKKTFSQDVSVAKMRSAISPNYIHSLDAELLRRVALRMKAEGINDSDWIHDSFGCHPNEVNLMLDITKEEFFFLLERDPLSVLDQELRSQVEDTPASFKALANTKVPHLNEFDVARLRSLYDSNWFFS